MDIDAQHKLTQINTTKQPLYNCLVKVAPWLAFTLMLLWGWRVYDLFNNIPAYGDALEVLWGIRWYHDALFIQHTSPLFTPLIFHPLGWYTATLAHTPVLFLLAQPL